MKKIVWIFLIVFLCGIVVADICTNKLLMADVVLTGEGLRKYATSKIVFNDVIWNLFYERLKQLICVLILRITPLKRYIAVSLIGILVFAFGFFTMSCILAIGFVGILIGLASVFPHGLLYIGGFNFLQSNRILAVMFFITGCVIECVIGVHFVPWIIRLSMI